VSFNIDLDISIKNIYLIVPKNFNEILSSYAKQGYRVLALAYKPLELNYVKIQRIERFGNSKMMTNII
jgi:magnesium-transporting ATPase (P-type)